MQFVAGEIRSLQRKPTLASINSGKNQCNVYSVYRSPLGSRDNVVASPLERRGSIPGRVNFLSEIFRGFHQI